MIVWNETYNTRRSISFESGTPMPIVIHVPLFNQSLDYEITAEAINIEYHDWVFSCKPDYHSKKYWYNIKYEFFFFFCVFCPSVNVNWQLNIFSLFGTNWSSNSTISVSKYLKRRHITLKLSDINRIDHSNLVFKIKNTKKPVRLLKL